MRFRKIITFKDLYDYIKKADVNEYGKYYPINTDSNISLHISDDQVEILSVNKILAIFIFFPDTEKVIIVDVNYAGCPEFDKASSISMNSEIDINESEFIKYLRHGTNVRNIILTILNQMNIVEVDDMDVSKFCSSSSNINIGSIISSTNRQLNELNNLKKSYVRYSGSTLNLSEYMENLIEDMCISIDKSAMKVISGDILNSIDEGIYNVDEIRTSMNDIHDGMTLELKEVHRAKEILALYNKC